MVEDRAERNYLLKFEGVFIPVFVLYATILQFFYDFAIVAPGWVVIISWVSIACVIIIMLYIKRIVRGFLSPYPKIGKEGVAVFVFALFFNVFELTSVHVPPLLFSRIDFPTLIKLYIGILGLLISALLFIDWANRQIKMGKKGYKPLT